jgi:hypothetical protein
VESGKQSDFSNATDTCINAVPTDAEIFIGTQSIEAVLCLNTADMQKDVPTNPLQILCYCVLSMTIFQTSIIAKLKD